MVTPAAIAQTKFRSTNPHIPASTAAMVSRTAPTRSNQGRGFPQAHRDRKDARTRAVPRD